MTLLNRKQILSSKLKTQTLQIPEWGGSVLIQEPTALERAEFELLSSKAATDDEVIRKIRGYCAAKCIVDEKGDRMFTDEDIEALNEKSANALDRVIDVYREMSLIENDDIEAAAKN